MMRKLKSEKRSEQADAPGQELTHEAMNEGHSSSPSAFPSTQLRLLTAVQVAEMLQVSPSWVREHSTSKYPKLPAMKLGTGKTAVVRYHPADIMEFVEAERRFAAERSQQPKWRN